MVNPIWIDAEDFTVIGAAWLLSGEDPHPPSQEPPPHVIQYLKRILRLIKYGANNRGSTVPSFLDRYASKPKPFHTGYILAACDAILDSGAPVKSDFFAKFVFTRSELKAVCRALSLRPSFLFNAACAVADNETVNEETLSAVKTIAKAFGLPEDFSAVKDYLRLPVEVWPQLATALGKRRDPKKDGFFKAVIQVRDEKPDITIPGALKHPMIKEACKGLRAEESARRRWIGIIVNPQRKPGPSNKIADHDT